MAIQSKIEKFRVIGAFARMQTISWDAEIKLIDGIPYMIDFSRDFSNVYLNGFPIREIHFNDLVDAATPKTDAGTCVFNGYALSGEEDYSGINIWEEFKMLHESDRNWRKEKKITKKHEEMFWKEYWRYLFG